MTDKDDEDRVRLLGSRDDGHTEAHGSGGTNGSTTPNSNDTSPNRQDAQRGSSSPSHTATAAATQPLPAAAAAAAADDPTDVSPYPTMRALDKEIMSVALPMLATLAADPLAGLVDSAYLGHAGAVQLAAVGVALSIFNTATKIFNAPLLAVTTSSVAKATGAAARARTGQGGGGGGGSMASGSAASAAGSHGSSGERHAGAGAGAVEMTPAEGRKAAVAVLDPEEAVTAVEAAAAAAEAEVAEAEAAAATASAQARAAGSCLLLAGAVGLLQAVVLLAAGPALVHVWGVAAGSPVGGAALAFLAVRAVGAPVTILMLTMQGVYRGLQDTRTPFYATLASNVLNIAVAPILIFGLRWGAGGAALGTVLSQAVPLGLMARDLARRLPLTQCWRGASGRGSGNGGEVERGVAAREVAGAAGGEGEVAAEKREGLLAAVAEVVPLFKPTGFLVLRSVSVTATYAIATTLVARAGTAATASHQVCFQLWLASSLLADALAVAAQSLMARDVGSGSLRGARQVAARVSSLCLGLGLILAAAMAAGGAVLPQLFSSDPAVLHLVRGLFPVLALTQPINVLAMTWDGILYGAGGFRYAAYSMAAAAIPAIMAMEIGSNRLAAAQTAAAGGAAAAAAAGSGGLSTAGAAELRVVWAGLTVLMVMRWLTIAVPYVLKVGPFRQLREAPGEGAPPPA